MPPPPKVCEAVQTIPFAAVIFFLDDNNQICKPLPRASEFSFSFQRQGALEFEHCSKF